MEEKSKLLLISKRGVLIIKELLNEMHKDIMNL